jgi:hypothetical protein
LEITKAQLDAMKLEAKKAPDPIAKPKEVAVAPTPPPAPAVTQEKWGHSGEMAMRVAAPLPAAKGHAIANAGNGDGLPSWRVRIDASEEQILEANDVCFAFARWSPRFEVLPVDPKTATLRDPVEWNRFAAERPHLSKFYVFLHDFSIARWKASLLSRGEGWEPVLFLSKDRYPAWRDDVERALRDRGLTTKQVQAIQSTVTIFAGQSRHEVRHVTPLFTDAPK